MQVLTYDHAVSQDKPGPNRSSDVLDAILGTIADNRTRTDTTNTLFRAKALDQLDVAADIDNQLPLVSRRNWLLLVGAALIVVAFVVWAALTPATQTVNATGRVLAASGLLAVPSPVEGSMQQMLVGSGEPIESGDPIAFIEGRGTSVQVISEASGIAWQVTKTVGSPVLAGEILLTMLPADSGSTALIVLPSSTASDVKPGMSVGVSGGRVGAVSLVTPPLPAADVQLRTGISVDPGSLASIVQVTLDEPGIPGRESTYTIQLTDKTVLQQMFSR